MENLTFTVSNRKWLKAFGIINMIAIKAGEITIGNYQGRKDERSCSLETFNNPDKYKAYKN